MHKKLCKCCSYSLTDIKIVLKEQNSQFTIYNDEELAIDKIKIDGCKVKENTKDARCDYSIIITSNEEISINLIELKGSDIKHAYEQIIEVVKKFYSNKDRKKLYAFISVNKMPSGSSSKQKLIEKSKKDNIVKLLIEPSKNCYFKIVDGKLSKTSKR